MPRATIGGFLRLATLALFVFSLSFVLCEGSVCEHAALRGHGAQGGGKHEASDGSEGFTASQAKDRNTSDCHGISFEASEGSEGSTATKNSNTSGGHGISSEASEGSECCETRKGRGASSEASEAAESQKPLSCCGGCEWKSMPRTNAQQGIQRFRQDGMVLRSLWLRILWGRCTMPGVNVSSMIRWSADVILDLS